MPNSSSPSSMAATACCGTGASRIEKSPEEPRKSRFQSACPGEDGRAGCNTAATSGRASSHCAMSSAWRSASRRRSSSVRRPRRARKTSSGPAHMAKTSAVSLRRGNQCGRRGDEAEQQIGMAGEIFRAGLDRHIGAAVMRRKEQRRRPGVVEDDAGALAARDRGDGRNVRQFEALRARRFEEDDAGVRPDQHVRCRRRSSGSK